ncbi:MAG: DUF2460 domain-containing protein, partial [bacterium]|nr:DUF2460 domain-containing protein [bacterium]
MTEVVFDMDYKSAYTTTIEFKTQINEKHFGKEQRYPVWTFPKRTFTLSFDKNFQDRKKLEDFYEKTKGGTEKFLFTWAKDKGGNGKQYLCFKQSLYEFGFSECELTFVAIDDNSVENVGAFDFWHSAEGNFSLNYKIYSDFEFSSRNDKKTYQDSPKHKWTLRFQKNHENREKIEKFFIAKRGQFRSFDWTWAEDRGGDGKTYKVRFANDTLNLSVSEFGFGEFEVDLVEVFSSENPLSEVEKDEIIPRKLLKIELEQGSVYILDNETLESLEFNGETYIGAPLTHGEIKNDDNSAVNKLEIELSNVNLGISGIIGNRGDVITNAFAVLTLVFLNVNTNELISNCQKVLYSGRCNNLSLDFEKATIDIETELGGYEKLAPMIKFRPTCQVRRFKDCRCGYSGEATTCDRTFQRCSDLGNASNFRGFP